MQVRCKSQKFSKEAKKHFEALRQTFSNIYFRKKDNLLNTFLFLFYERKTLGDDLPNG